MSQWLIVSEFNPCSKTWTKETAEYGKMELDNVYQPLHSTMNIGKNQLIWQVGDKTNALHSNISKSDTCRC